MVNLTVFPPLLMKQYSTPSGEEIALMGSESQPWRVPTPEVRAGWVDFRSLELFDENM